MQIKTSNSSANPARGFVMLEALVALLIFAIGILGLVGAQSASVKDASNARYRAIAAAMAGDLINRMWLSDRTASTLQASFDSASAGSGYSSWLARVQVSGLPGVDDHPPEVSFSTVAGGGSEPKESSLATVKVYWKAPGDSRAHTHIALAQLK